MADYKPQALDVRDVGATAMGSPARAAMYAGVARRNPALLGGFAAAEGRTLRDITNRAYSENADVNAMLNDLAQSDQYNDYMKNMGDVAGKAISAHSRAGYMAPIGTILGNLYPELAPAGDYANQYDIVGDAANINNVKAQALQRERLGQAALTNAAAARTRANASSGISTNVVIDPVSQQPTISYKQPGFKTQPELEAMGIKFPTVNTGGAPTADEQPAPIADYEDTSGGDDVYTFARNGRLGEGMAIVGENDVPDGEGGTVHVIEYTTEGGKQLIDVYDTETGDLVHTYSPEE